jgi:hypothetical protein
MAVLYQLSYVGATLNPTLIGRRLRIISFEYASNDP